MPEIDCLIRMLAGIIVSMKKLVRIALLFFLALVVYNLCLVAYEKKLGIPGKTFIEFGTAGHHKTKR